MTRMVSKTSRDDAAKVPGVQIGLQPPRYHLDYAGWHAHLSGRRTDLAAGIAERNVAQLPSGSAVAVLGAERWRA